MSILAPVDSQISRITFPPGPITSLIFSLFIENVVTLGALSETVSRPCPIAFSISAKICNRPSRACSNATFMISSVMEVILISICKEVMPVDVPATLKSISPR